MPILEFWHIAFPSSVKTTGSLSNFDDNRNMNVINLYIWQRKATVLRSIFHFCSFRRRSRFFHEVKRPVLQLCGRLEHIMTNVQFCLPTSETLVPILINSRIVWSHFASLMTLSNWKNDCRNSKLHFQKTFTLWSTSYLLKLFKDLEVGGWLPRVIVKFY